MILSYGDLVESIADELARDDLGAKIPEWIFLAESALTRAIGIIDGEQLFSSNLVPAQAYIDMPAGFRRPIHIEIQSSPLRVLQIVSMDKRSDVLQNDVTGHPRTISYIGRRGYLAPVPALAEAYDLFYYGKPPLLSDANPSNDLLDMGPDVIKYSALIYSAPYLGTDDRLQTWNLLAASGAATLKREYWDAHFGGGTTRIRPDFAPGDTHDQGSFNG